MVAMSHVGQSRPIEELLRPSGWLLRAATDVGHVIKANALKSSSVDSTTLDLLLRLRFAPGNRMRGVDLCNQLHKSPSHLSRVLDRAEAFDLVTRSPDPSDRRAHLIAATPKGEAAVDEYLPHLETVLERVVFSTLTTDEIDTLVELLSRLSRAATTLTAPTTA